MIYHFSISDQDLNINPQESLIWKFGIYKEKSIP